MSRTLVVSTIALSSAFGAIAFATPASKLPAVRAPVAADLADYTKPFAGKGDLTATIDTSMGAIHCKLFEADAPIAVANFVGLATGKKSWTDPKSGKTMTKPFYDGLTFHRVIPDFMIQGGDAQGDGTGGPGYQFANETSPNVKFQVGSLAMANAGPNTNGSQFFVTESAPAYLQGGYTIFGSCTDGEVVKKIARAPKAAGSPELPSPAILIKKVTIARTAAAAPAPKATDTNNTLAK
jgi:peptidyl-prolyl cis-trans isomerase A (cyclophilin A)